MIIFFKLFGIDRAVISFPNPIPLTKANSETERDLGKVDHSQSSPADGEFNPWSEAADAAVWSLQDEGGEDFQYVNLELNPEKFTG